MKFIQGQNRTQTYLFPVLVDEAIDVQNEVRVIDLFVDSLDLCDFGFKVEHTEKAGQTTIPLICKRMKKLSKNKNYKFDFFFEIIFLYPICIS